MKNTFSHEPEEYVCPFCEFLAGKPDRYNSEEDIVYRNEFTIAFIAPKWWVNNEGHVLVVPNKHYENIYSIPDDQLAEVYKTVKKVATAIRSTYDCDGTSTRQHNEPAGDQDVWHLHVHVYPAMQMTSSIITTTKRHLLKQNYVCHMPKIVSRLGRYSLCPIGTRPAHSLERLRSL